MFSIYRAHSGWFWYPILGQFLGGILGGLFYEVTVGIHHPNEDEDYYPEEKKPLKDDPETAEQEEE